MAGADSAALQNCLHAAVDEAVNAMASQGSLDAADSLGVSYMFVASTRPVLGGVSS